MIEQKYRDDGWPLCPQCGEDELWSRTGTDLARHVRLDGHGWTSLARGNDDDVLGHGRTGDEAPIPATRRIQISDAPDL